MQLFKKMLAVGLTAIFFAVAGYAQEDNTAPDIDRPYDFGPLGTMVDRAKKEFTTPTDIGSAGLKKETSVQNPSTVTVISRETIDEYNFSSISSAVKTLAGIQVYRTAFKQQVSTARGVLQDHYANKVLVMINGIPSWHAITGEGNLERVSIHDVERIEVLRGPASVIYGSQAYTGAINIVLREKPESDEEGKFHGKFHGGLGNKGARSVGAHHYRYKEDGLSVFAAINEERGNRYSHDFTDEDNVTGVIDDYLDSLNATLLLEYDDHSLLINAFQNDEGNYEGVNPKFSEGAGKNHDVDGIIFGYSFSHAWNKKYRSNLQLFYDLNERNFSRSGDDDIRANVLGYRVGGNFHNLFSISDNLDIQVGGDYELRKSQEYRTLQHSTQEILHESNLFDRSVYEYAGYAQVDWKLSPAWGVVFGGRFTDNEKLGRNDSFRGTIAYFIDKRNTIKFIAGQSFRAPSFFELYFKTPEKTVFGNENLKPETADTFELSYQYAKGSFYMQTLAYYSLYKNKIRRIKDDFFEDGITYQNVNVYNNGDEFTATGLEVELKYLNPNFVNVFLNLDYVDGDDGDKLPGSDHYNFKYVPKFTASAGVYKNFGGFSASIIGNYIGSMNGSSSEKVDDSATFDLNFAYQHKYESLKVKHVLSIRNVLDTQVTFPEYVRRNLNEIPQNETDRGIFYSLTADF
ncbi:MAG: TonB-dependent receptor [Pseudomonadota bacterium]